MQAAICPDSPGADLGVGPTRSERRANKFLVATAAMVGAGAMAVTPVTQSLPEMHAIQTRAVQLVAAVTDSPAEVYQGFFELTAANLTSFGENWSATPFPLLSQVIENQTGYAETLGAAVESVPTVLQNWYENGKGESKPGAEYLANFQTAAEAGDFNTAYDNLNRFLLFGIQNAAAPFTSILLSSTNRQTGVYTPGIPEQIAQNFADAVAATFSSTTVNSGIFQAVFAPISGANWEIARAIEAVSTAASSGDAEGALNALLNTPAVLLSAVVNGFDYDDGDTVAPWAGLATGCIGKTGRCASGALEQLLITIPTRIATAIDNTPATTTSGITGVFSVAESKGTTESTGGTVSMLGLDGQGSAESAGDTTKTLETGVRKSLVIADTDTDTTTTKKSKAAERAASLKAAREGVAASVKKAADGLKKALGGGKTSADDSSSSTSGSGSGSANKADTGSE